jgi:hypothetical protein
MSEHAWVQENLDAYITGGLSAQECDRVERHLKSCSECAHLKAEINEMEHLMEGICARVYPDAGLEDRAIQRLRQAPRRRPNWLRFVAAAAAVVVLGTVGGVVRMLALDGTLPLPGMEQQVAKTTFTTVGQKIGAKKDAAKEEAFSIVDVDPAATEFDTDIQYKHARKAEVTVPGAYHPNEAVGIRDGEKSPPPIKLPAPGGFSNAGQGGAVEIGGEKANQAKADVQGERFFANKHKEQPANDSNKVSRGDLALDGRFYDKAMKDGLQQSFDSPKKQEEMSKALEKLGTDDLKAADKMAALGKTTTSGGSGGGGGATTARPPAGIAGIFNPPPGMTLPPSVPGLGPATTAMNPPLPGVLPPLPKVLDPLGPATPPMAAPLPVPASAPPPYLPMAPPPVAVVQDKPAETKGDSDPAKKPDGKAVGDKKPEAPEQPKVEPKEPPPEKMGRMIIRTGEMEFETDSFKDSVLKITKLVKNKGGFVATVNSDKLPNGKMRGNIVVRMPPGVLDDFLVELPDILPKNVLKNQRIGSQDVGKQYSDIESRLRAARAIEDRLIQIIKTGKGEIKDLVNAEKELGVWRTKIEEMEGEIRYLANQVALSTLTIQLYEKEIESPTAIVITETVTMRIEVEDVAKSHKAAMNLVKELKGRLTRSDLKQHPGGQFLSILHAEIAPNKKDEFIAQLSKLGIISDRQEHQAQQTEGGTGKPTDLKQREADVCFQVTMNNTANIRPRVSADLKIATTDVPGAYAKLLDTIAKVKGQVRDGKLNEQDKLNIHAHLDFNVPTSEKPAIDKLLEEIGPVLERINVQAQISELSTASKFGYTLVLRDFASIPPRQALAQSIAVINVPAAYAKLQDAIALANAKAKGQIADAKLNEQDKLNITAQFEFTVPSEQKAAIEKVLGELGSELSRNNVQTPANQLATPKKFGFSILLRDLASIPPRQSLVQSVAAIDVPAAYAEIQKAVTKAKGQVSDAKLNEQDKLNITAQLVFTVPAEEKAGIEKFLNELGTVLSRNNVQVPAQQLATPKKFGFSLFLRDFASIPPSKATDLKVATSDVPGSYAKLLELIASPKIKGQLVDARLNEQDKFNISAQVDFSVLTDDKAAIDKLLGEFGTILSRNNVQAPINQLSIAKKFGYSVTLRDFANILPTHAADIKLATTDVPNNYARLVDAVVKAKGQIGAAKLNEQDKLNVSAFLNFTVPIDQKQAIDKLLGEIGTMLSRNNVQAPTSELTTERKFGYAISLRDFANIPPRETFTLQIAAVDVAASFRELQDAVTAAKGSVSVGQLSEDNKVKMEATFVFDVPAAERQAIEKLFGKVGAVFGRTSSQVAINDLATDQKVGFKLTIRSTASIPPRDTVHVKLEVKDVDGRATDLKDLVLAGKGRVIDSNIDRHENGQVLGVLKFEVPYVSEDSLLRQIKGVGTVVSQQAKRDPKVPENELTTAHIIVTLAGVTPIVPSDEGLGSYVRTSLYMSFKVFSVCLMLIILGVSAVLPWALVIWVAYKAYCRFGGSRNLQLAAATGPTPPSAPTPQA